LFHIVFALTDPHFSTFDGTKYSFHGQCDLVMARSTEIGTTGLGMVLHARTEISTGGWSFISNAALQIGKDIFEITNDGSYYVNGIKDVETPHLMVDRFPISKREKIVKITSSDGVPIDAVRSMFTIQLDDGDNIEMIVFKNLIFVHVNAILKASEGMLGIQGKAGMIARDGQSVLNDPNEMGLQWQVKDTEPMLFREIRGPQYPEQCILPNVQSRRLRTDTKHRKMRAEAACNGVPKEVQDFCIDDVLLTGDADIVYGYGEAF
jgi:von Willebrand factor type D domain